MKALALILLASISHAQSYYDTFGNRTSSKTYYNVYRATATALADVGAPDLSLSSRTANASKTFYLTDLEVVAGLSTTNALGEQRLGYVSIESPANTVIDRVSFTWPTAQTWKHNFIEPLAIASGTLVRITVTPSTTTGVSWGSWMRGFER